MRIGVLTSGGDCPGLNAVIRSVVHRAVVDHGDEVIGFRDGWKGLLECDYLKLDLDAVSGILARGGTILGSSRVQPSHLRDGVERAKGHVQELGEADAFGHRRKVNIAEVLAAEIKERTGVETVFSDLTYDLRSGEPDSLDQMVAITFANVAMDLIADGQRGRMVGIRDGKYAHSPLPDPALGARHVDVDGMYNVERLRPRYFGLLGHPLLLGEPIPAEALSVS